MKTYEITVNGKVYVVTAKEIDAAAAAAQPQAAPASTPAPEPPKQEAPAPTVPSGGVEVAAPMPGNVWQVTCNIGDTVKAGDTLLILEAMKMENEIVAPQDGTVSQILVKKGDAVEAGTLLITL